MNNEEKILAILEKHGEMLERMDGRLEKLETGQAVLEGRMERLESDQRFLKLAMNNLERRQAAFEGRIGRLEEHAERIAADVSGIKVRLDVDVQKQLDLVEEGQDSLDRRLSHVEELAEGTRDKVDVIHAAVAEHSLDIAGLKKAQ